MVLQSPVNHDPASSFWRRCVEVSSGRRAVTTDRSSHKGRAEEGYQVKPMTLILNPYLVLHNLILCRSPTCSVLEHIIGTYNRVGYHAPQLLVQHWRAPTPKLAKPWR